VGLLDFDSWSTGNYSGFRLIKSGILSEEAGLCEYCTGFDFHLFHGRGKIPCYSTIGNGFFSLPAQESVYVSLSWKNRFTEKLVTVY
jgi:hypothetical protein